MKWVLQIKGDSDLKSGRFEWNSVHLRVSYFCERFWCLPLFQHATAQNTRFPWWNSFSHFFFLVETCPFDKTINNLASMAPPVFENCPCLFLVKNSSLYVECGAAFYQAGNTRHQAIVENLAWLLDAVLLSTSREWCFCIGTKNHALRFTPSRHQGIVAETKCLAAILASNLVTGFLPSD